TTVIFYVNDGLAIDSEVVTITVENVPCPDFSIEVFSLDGPQQISFDRVIQNRINLEIQNSGEIGIFDTLALEFYVSSDPDFLNCDCFIDPIGFQLLDSVPVGSQFEVVLEQNLSLNSDGNIGNGNYWLGVVIDRNDSYGDCDTSNNYFVIPIVVDNNIPPILDPIGDKEVNEGDTLDFVVSAIDWDFDEIYLDYYVDNNCECIDVNFVDSGNGHASFEWSPGFNLAGDYAFEFYAYDNFKSGDQENVTIKVNNTNRSPIIDTLPDTLRFNEGDKIGFRVFASDPDDDCFELALNSPDLPPGATFDYVFDCVDYGDFSWLPGFGDDGIYHAIFVATDDGGAVGEDTVVLVIININAPPEFDFISSYDIVENDTLDFQISVTDVDGNLASIYTEQLPVGASFVYHGNGSGTFNWVPDCSQSDEYSITCFAADDSGLVDTSYLNIYVGEACDIQLTVVTTPCVQCSPPLAFTDILVSDQSFAIEFNKYLIEGSISENISISSTRGDELYYGYDIKNKSIIIYSESMEFVPIDTILVTLSTGILDLDNLPLDSNYNLTYTVGPVVYPGDCNNNGVVDEVDVLSIGLFWNQDGPDRNVGGEYGPLDFFDQPAHFQEQGNGEWENRNAVYADVDGSGVVDADDLCGIAVNFAKNSYEDVSPKGADASSGTASLNGLNSKVLEEMRLALIECPEGAPKARMLEAIENALRASTVVLPSEIELHQNYPNPFNPSTTIEFFLPKAEYATLSIYNMLGQEVITLLDEKVEAGYKEVIWNGKDNSGHQVASGIYFYKLNTETKEIIKRMLLVK
ncbi:MAG TPA: T9SS type A sorting domain-containing protein, partial [candidate division Zixibacteria bacterium]|nr:T9SS type A sorting domain-containing protein [candidate division Zixibacteria bacterium]